MRLFLAFSLLGLMAACSGDSSSVMSSWNDEATGGAAGTGGIASAGGSGGHVQGGSGGSVTVPSAGGAGGGSSVVVRGGVRDSATAQCTVTSSGGGCAVDAALLSCVKDKCGNYLAACFQGTAGPCGEYAACMFACPCDSGRSACENLCLTDKGFGSDTCNPRMLDFLSCWSVNGCTLPTCTTK
jgi:hypothetical protein